MVMNGPIPHSDVWSPRIEHHVFTMAQFLFLSLAIIAAGARTGTRIYRFKKVTIDDVFLILAVVFFAVATGVIHVCKNLVYRSTYINLGLLKPPPDYAHDGLQYSIYDNVVTVFVWASIFSVKVSFVMFFKQLIQRVRNIQVWWWIVLVVVCGAAPVNMFMGFYICPDFSENIQKVCPKSSIIANTKVYLYTSCILDIVTDVLVLSIPVALLWKVQIDLRRKLALLTVLGLSVFMIIIAIIRVSLVQITLPNGRSAPDTPWLFFWQNIEAATAIIMVSVTAFRSMLGQKSSSTKGSKESKGSSTSSSGRRYAALRNSSGSDQIPLAAKTGIVKTTEISNSYGEKDGWEQAEVSRSGERMALSELPADRRYDDGVYMERG